MTARKPKGRRDYRPAPPREDDPLWWTKYVPCADEDDDRWDGDGFVNPRHEAARARAARWLARRGVERHPFGWQPAMTVTHDGREVTDRDGVRAAQARGARRAGLLPGHAPARRRGGPLAGLVLGRRRHVVRAARSHPGGGGGGGGVGPPHPARHGADDPPRPALRGVTAAPAGSAAASAAASLDHDAR